MKKIYVILCFSTLLISCRKDVNEEFIEYINSLDPITLPFNHTYSLDEMIENDGFPNISTNFNNAYFKKFQYHQDAIKPLGILYKNENNIGIVELTEVSIGLFPVIMTYDMMGNKIDSLIPYENFGEDLGYSCKEHLVFEANKITRFDTLRTWKLNKEETDIIEGTMTEKTNIKTFVINPKTGKISK